ncbi:hypothetical protein ALC62_08985 [Cyphomyrmex costatus]|uniref:Uncharacterized protein n=1 Tax=Cyphomyrmex costatus TaxID=456900 RepID=A0A151IGC7_9HYME|nr:hypothetical protein ALC62_08985 [Cyphomyrmex costatus]
MFPNPFNRKHSTIRQFLDRIFDSSKKTITRFDSLCTSNSKDNWREYHGTFGGYYALSHNHRNNHRDSNLYSKK